MKVLILLSTYNGREFLKDQLDSILHQKYSQIRILIRDDGSTDSTMEILSKYKAAYPDKIDLIEGENIGWKKSFFELLRLANEKYKEYDFFAFSDQDDIWLPDKIEKAISELIKLPQGPNLYCSNQYYYKNGYNFGLIRKKKSESSYKSCLVKNNATGCTIVFNKKLLNLISYEFPSVDIAHDYWLYMVAVLCGHVYIDDNGYILYRQHDNNQIGSKSSWMDIWKRRIKSLKIILNDHRIERQAKELLKIFSQNMNQDSREAVTKIADYRTNLKNKLRLLDDKGYTLGNKSNDRWLKLKIVLGIL